MYSTRTHTTHTHTQTHTQPSMRGGGFCRGPGCRCSLRGVALQVPANGQPVMFLADNPLTGGYPVIGCVAPHHLDLAAQLPPGVFVRFKVMAPFAEIPLEGAVA